MTLFHFVIYFVMCGRFQIWGQENAVCGQEESDTEKNSIQPPAAEKHHGNPEP